MSPLLFQSHLNLQWSRPKCGKTENQKLFGCRLHIATDLAVTRLSMLHCYSKSALIYSEWFTVVEYTGSQKICNTLYKKSCKYNYKRKREEKQIVFLATAYIYICRR